MSWRGAYGPWPGRGPFSHLPPWQRPGRLYGPGSCMWLFRQGFIPPYMSQNTLTLKDQITILEAYKKENEIELKEINEEIERMKKNLLDKTNEEK